MFSEVVESIPKVASDLTLIGPRNFTTRTDASIAFFIDGEKAVRWPLYETSIELGNRQLRIVSIGFRLVQAATTSIELTLNLTGTGEEADYGSRPQPGEPQSRQLEEPAHLSLDIFTTIRLGFGLPTASLLEEVICSHHSTPIARPLIAPALRSLTGVAWT